MGALLAGPCAGGSADILRPRCHRGTFKALQRRRHRRHGGEGEQLQPRAQRFGLLAQYFRNLLAPRLRLPIAKIGFMAGADDQIQGHTFS
jgi:hypothetical protein